MNRLTDQQVNFFNTFGYLVFPGLVKDDLDWIYEGFNQVFTALPEKHDGTRRTIAGTDSSPLLCTLLDHPKIVGAASSILGDDFNYLGGDANYYTGDTGWHPDGDHRIGHYVKIAFYLDPVQRDTGCLRVLPGTHWRDGAIAPQLRQLFAVEEKFGIHGRDVPAVPLESQPGDVVMFNHNIWHAAYGGNNRRRMFTLNLCNQAKTPEELQELRGFINSAARFWVTQTHSDTMRQTAGPERMRHLQQVMDNEDELPELVRKAKESMAEPARG